MTMTLARQGLGRKALQAEGTVSAKAPRGVFGTTESSFHRLYLRVLVPRGTLLWVGMTTFHLARSPPGWDLLFSWL